MTDPNPALVPDPTVSTPTTFDVLPLSADIRKGVDTLGFKNPTPVQRAVFEAAVRGKSLVVQARTGTGKTAAFGLPLVDTLVRKSIEQVQALILTPTRELALQVARELEGLSQFRGLKIASIYGGAPMGQQVEALASGTQIVAGTPGRVLDHLRRGTLDASGIRVFVLDEADEMLSMGFAKELNAIVEHLPKDRQGLFFSATIPPDIERLAVAQLKEPEFITLSSDQVGAQSIAHFVYVVRGGGDKRQDLLRILEVEDPESAVIFCNTKDETQRVAETLQNKGFDADWLNGDLDQKERERVLAKTREGKLRFLVATDVAARGIDISHLTHVINADFPESAEAYVHRTGRTGRAGRTGTAISLVGPKDVGNLYLLRLTYKIRPIEKQIPSAGELKTRAEQDLVNLFVEAFANRNHHAEDLALSRRLLTHGDVERILAGLLRDHLGARPGDAAAEAAETRRARNPKPVAAEEPAAPPPGREGRGEGKRDERHRDERRRDERGRDARDERGRDERGRDGKRDDPRREMSPRNEGAPRQRDEGRNRDRDRSRSSSRQRSEVAVGDNVIGFTVGDAPAPERRAPAVPRPARAPHRRPSGQTSGEAGATQEFQGEPGFAEGAWGQAPSPDEGRGPGWTVESSPPSFPPAPSDGVELFVNVGRRDRVSEDLLADMLSKGHVPPDSVLGIRVRDRMTFLTVKRDFADQAARALAGQELGGRILVAEMARGRSGAKGA